MQISLKICNYDAFEAVVSPFFLPVNASIAWYMPITSPKNQSKILVGRRNCQNLMKWKPNGIPRNEVFLSIALMMRFATYSGLSTGMIGDFTPSNIPVFI